MSTPTATAGASSSVASKYSSAVFVAATLFLMVIEEGASYESSWLWAYNNEIWLPIVSGSPKGSVLMVLRRLPLALKIEFHRRCGTPFGSCLDGIEYIPFVSMLNDLRPEYERESFFEVVCCTCVGCL